MDVLDALMPDATCWHVLWLWWHPQLQGSDWCLKSEMTMLAECWTLSPDKKQVYGFPSAVSASVIVYETSGPLLPANSANHPPPVWLGDECSLSVPSRAAPPLLTQPSSCRHFTTLDPAFVHISTHSA